MRKIPFLQLNHHASYSYQMLLYKEFFGMLAIAIALLLIPFTTYSQTSETTTKTLEPVPLHDLGNEELLKQAQNIFDQASNHYLAQLRNLNIQEFLLSKAQEETAVFRFSRQEATLSEEITSLEKSRILLEQTKVQMEESQQQLKLIETEKTSLDQYIEHIEPAQSAAKSLLSALDELDLFLLRIQLRITDGTLRAVEVPAVLQEESLRQTRREVIDQQRVLIQETEKANETLKTTVERIQGAKETVIEFKALHASSEKKFAQELNRQNVEQEYVQQTPEELLFELSELQEELVWLKGAFNLSLGRFNSSLRQTEQKQKQIEGLSAPETKDLFQSTVTQAEEIERLAKQVEDIVQYHTTRIKQFWELRSALQSLITNSEFFQGDAAVLSEHFFRMQVIAKILESHVQAGTIELDRIPQVSREAALVKANETVSTQVAEVVSSTQKASEQLNQIVGEVQKSESARSDIEERLEQMKKTSKAAQEAQQWSAKLKDLTAQQLVQRFEENAEQLQNNEANLQKVKELYHNSKATADETRTKFESLKDPLLSSAQEESAVEKNNMFKRLYELAELELPAEKKTTLEAPAAESVPPTSTEADIEKQEYLNLMNTRIQIDEEREKFRKELLEALNTLQTNQKAYVESLNEASRLALQRYANSVELKKRLGRQELKSYEVPYGITEGLKRDRIVELEAEIAALAQQQVQLSAQIKNYSEVDESMQEIQAWFGEIIGLVGKRLDILTDVKKLEQEAEQYQSERSESEMKSLRQAAGRRLEEDETIQEYLVNFFPSVRAESLTDLLKDHFVELADLEGKQRNLDSQKEEYDRLIRLAQEEEETIAKLLPFFQKQNEQLEIRDTEAWAAVRVRFMPEKAEEILSKFEEKSGYRFSIPAPIEKESKAAAVEEILPSLFDLYTQNVAIAKWIEVFSQRLSPVPSGLNAEIGNYQASIGNLNSQNDSIQRRIDFLLGHPEGQLPTPEPGTKSMTGAEKHHFLSGEISVLREERYAIGSQAGILVISILVSILVVTFLLMSFINTWSNRVIRREEEKENTSSQTILVYSLIRGALKLAVAGLAFLISLHYVGFDVGAILAGLGIFGFAIALASKESISNFIGGITILLAKPFEVDDYLMLGNKHCGVEKIGLQYTHLRHFKTAHINIVPNAKLSESIVVNTNSKDYQEIRMDSRIALSSRNSFEKMQLAKQIIREVFDQTEGARIKALLFEKFEDFAFVIQIRIDFSDVDEFRPPLDEVNSKIVQRFQANGIEFGAAPFFQPDPPGEAK